MTPDELFSAVSSCAAADGEISSVFASWCGAEEEETKEIGSAHDIGVAAEGALGARGARVLGGLLTRGMPFSMRVWSSQRRGMSCTRRGDERRRDERREIEVALARNEWSRTRSAPGAMNIDHKLEALIHIVVQIICDALR
jgi:hypothetical protein